MNVTIFLFLQEISSSDYSGPIVFLNNVDISFSDSIILEFCVFKLCQFKFYSLDFITPIVVVFYYFIKYIPINLRPCLGYSFWDRVFLVISFSVNSLLVCKHVAGFCVSIFFQNFTEFVYYIE